MKTVLACLLICALSLGVFCACSDNRTETTPPVVTTTPGETLIPDSMLPDPEDGVIEETKDPDHTKTPAPDHSVSPTPMTDGGDAQ